MTSREKFRLRLVLGLSQAVAVGIAVPAGHPWRVVAVLAPLSLVTSLAVEFLIPPRERGRQR